MCYYGYAAEVYAHLQRTMNNSGKETSTTLKEKIFEFNIFTHQQTNFTLDTIIQTCSSGYTKKHPVKCRQLTTVLLVKSHAAKHLS